METEQVQKNIQQFLENKVNEADAEGLVLGLSGGIDSATCLKLAVNALGKERITALIMPGEPSRETNTDDARELAEGLGVETIEIDIGDTVDSFQQDLPLQTGKEGLGNIRARTRMVYTYAVANEKNLLVLGTGNRTEYLLGYFTKYGDGATDIAPLLDLYKTEVKELAEHIGLDRKFIEKKPTAGLWEGQTDEDEIGTDYETMEGVLKLLVDEERPVEEIVEDSGVDRETVENLEAMYRSSEHKRIGSQGLHLFDR